MTDRADTIGIESSLLGSLMIEGTAGVAHVAHLLKSEQFLSAKHRAIYSAIIELFSQGEAIDSLTVHSKVTAGGMKMPQSELIQLTLDATSNYDTLDTYARIIVEHCVARDLGALGEVLARTAKDPTIDVHEAADKAYHGLMEITGQMEVQRPVALSETVNDLSDMIERYHNRDIALAGLPTGFFEIDRKTGGLERGCLYLVAGRPSMGKSALAMDWAWNMAQTEHVPFFSIEMTRRNMELRLVSKLTGIPYDRLRAGNYDDEIWKRLTSAFQKIAASKMIVHDQSDVGLTDLMAHTKRLKMEKNIPGIFVDYLQMMRTPKADTRDQAIGKLTRGLKMMAKDLDIFVVLVSAMNRGVESRESKKPQMSDLRESGAIEYDADGIFFVYRPERYGMATLEDGRSSAGVAQIIIGKQRNGPTAEIEMHFDGPTTSFKDIDWSHSLEPAQPGSGIVSPPKLVPPKTRNFFDDDDDD